MKMFKNLGECQKVNCPEGAREATLGCVGLRPPRNDTPFLTRSQPELSLRLVCGYSTDFRASAMLIFSSWKYMTVSTIRAAAMVSTAEIR